MSLGGKRTASARLLSEFLVIVVGVFVAFQVEDWTDARENARRETTLLEALLADFEATRENLEETLASEQVAIDRARALLAIMDRGGLALAGLSRIPRVARLHVVRRRARNRRVRRDDQFRGTRLDP